jgi:hypothetical protein
MRPDSTIQIDAVSNGEVTTEVLTLAGGDSEQ